MILCTISWHVFIGKKAIMCIYYENTFTMFTKYGWSKKKNIFVGFILNAELYLDSVIQFVRENFYGVVFYLISISLT